MIDDFIKHECDLCKQILLLNRIHDKEEELCFECFIAVHDAIVMTQKETK